MRVRHYDANRLESARGRLTRRDNLAVRSEGAIDARIWTQAGRSLNAGMHSPPDALSVTSEV